MSDDDTYEIPLQDQRVFGAGIKRQRVKFVPSSSSTSIAPATVLISAKSVSELYLSMVLPKDGTTSEGGARSTLPSASPTAFSDTGLPPPSMIKESDPQVCEICNLPRSSTDDTVPSDASSHTADISEHRPSLKPRPHEASLAHQVCLAHSHPPSHLDRNRKGLAYLSAYGWDPDSRKGLGAEGQGVQFPIKTKPKDNNLGIGVVLPKLREIKKREKLNKLDAGKVRKLQETDKRKGEKLREIFYRSEDVEHYLGGG